MFLGSFESAELAARVYDEACRQLDKPVLNFPEESRETPLNIEAAKRLDEEIPHFKRWADQQRGREQRGT